MEHTPAQDIIEYLHTHDIPYISHRHPAVFTVAEARELTVDIEGIDAKTLLVFTEKSRELYLVSLVGDNKLEQARIKALIGERVRFASPADLKYALHTAPGAVSPLGLIFDTDHTIKGYIIDQDILDAPLVTWHPNDNSQTLQLTQEAFQRYLHTISHPVMHH